MKIKEENISGWDGYRWKCGDISLGFVPQLGGRIMSLKYSGQEIFFVQEKHRGEVFTPKEIIGNKKAFGFRVWGGNKTWIAPEKLWVDNIPPLDLDAGQYSFFSNEDKVVMISAVCRETGLRITREVEITADLRIVLTETIKNETPLPIKRGIWNVSQVLRPCEIYVQSSIKDVRLYEEEVYKNCRVEEYLKQVGSWAQISCRDSAHFKFGCLPDLGKVITLQRTGKSILAFAKSFSVNNSSKYAHGSSIEVYNSPIEDYCEVEVHSPLITLGAGRSFFQNQEWQLKAFAPDMSVENILASY